MPNESQEQKNVTPLAEHPHAGAVLAILVVILILIVGGLYLWGATLSEQNEARVERAIPNNEPETTRAVTDRQILDTTSASNEIEAIYADLDSTNLNDLDSELDTIETGMNAALR